MLDVGVIAIRRKFIPPVGDTYQDAFIVLHDDVGIDEPVLFMSGLERQADTLSPLVRVPFYDDTITRVKADALLYDEDSFSWFHAEGIISVNVDAHASTSPSPICSSRRARRTSTWTWSRPTRCSSRTPSA